MTAVGPEHNRETGHSKDGLGVRATAQPAQMPDILTMGDDFIFSSNKQCSLSIFDFGVRDVKTTLPG